MKKLLIAIVGVILAVAWFTLGKKAPVTPPPAPLASDEPGLEEPADEAPRKLSPRALGLAGRYKLVYDAKYATNAGTNSVYTLTAELRVTPDEPGDTRVVELLSPTGGFVGQATAAAADPMVSFTSPFRIVMAENGALEDAVFPADMPNPARGVLLHVMSVSQLAQPAAAEQARWTATERDANSDYEVDYVRSSLVEHTKTWRAEQGQAKDQSVYLSRGRATLQSGKQAIESVNATVEQSFTLGFSAKQTLDVTVRISLSRLGSEPVIALATERPTVIQHPTGFTSYQAEEVVKPTQKEKDVQRVLGRSFNTIVADIERADAAGNWQARRAFGFDLAALMRVNPPVIAQTVAQIPKTEREPVRRTLVESLANAGTPPAQQALTQVMSDPKLDQMTQLQARSASSFVHEPTPELLDKLDKDTRSTDPSVRSASVLAFASVLQTFDANEEDGAEERVTEFIDRANGMLVKNGILPPPDGARATPPEFKRQESVLWLRALAATKDERAFPAFERAVVHADYVVRAHAVLGVSGFDGDRPNKIIAPLIEDKHPLVRHNALLAAVNRPPVELLEPTRRALFGDKRANNRSQAAFAIAMWSHKQPELKALLKEAISKEEDPKVINQILDLTIPQRGYTRIKESRQIGGAP